jgi:hypothetical protein
VASRPEQFRLGVHSGHDAGAQAVRSKLARHADGECVSRGLQLGNLTAADSTASQVLMEALHLLLVQRAEDVGGRIGTALALQLLLMAMVAGAQETTCPDRN